MFVYWQYLTNMSIINHFIHHVIFSSRSLWYRSLEVQLYSTFIRTVMARESPVVDFKMYFKIRFETVIRGHHVCKHTWTHVLDQVFEYDYNSIIGVYQEIC